MARIAGVDIPNEKRIVVSLTYIYGIGNTTAKKICDAAGVSVDIRTKNLTDEQLTALRSEVAKYRTEGDLRREVALNIKRLTEIGCYRGILAPMPVRAKVRERPLRTRRKRRGKEVNNNG